MSSLKDKNIIVTGASGGIGNSIVEKLNQNGANILATGTRIEKLEELKEKFNNIHPKNVAEETENNNCLIKIVLFGVACLLAYKLYKNRKQL